MLVKYFSLYIYCKLIQSWQNWFKQKVKLAIREKSVISDNGKGHQNVFLNEITRKGLYMKTCYDPQSQILRPPISNPVIDHWTSQIVIIFMSDIIMFVKIFLKNFLNIFLRINIYGYSMKTTRFYHYRNYNTNLNLQGWNGTVKLG